MPEHAVREFTAAKQIFQLADKLKKARTANPDRPLPKTLLILDDCAAQAKNQLIYDARWQSILNIHRHLELSIIFTTQTFQVYSPHAYVGGSDTAHTHTRTHAVRLAEYAFDVRLLGNFRHP